MRSIFVFFRIVLFSTQSQARNTIAQPNTNIKYSELVHFLPKWNHKFVENCINVGTQFGMERIKTSVCHFAFVLLSSSTFLLFIFACQVRLFDLLWGHFSFVCYAFTSIPAHVFTYYVLLLIFIYKYIYFFHLYQMIK